eukprot:365202-Chlamydomonas_euryale.AAC.5
MRSYAPDTGRCVAAAAAAAAAFGAAAAAAFEAAAAAAAACAIYSVHVEEKWFEGSTLASKNDLHQVYMGRRQVTESVERKIGS